VRLKWGNSNNFSGGVKRQKLKAEIRVHPVLIPKLEAARMGLTRPNGSTLRCIVSTFISFRRDEPWLFKISVYQRQSAVEIL
jgi:hypothetical protein